MKTLQNFLAQATPKATDDLQTALLRLPEDKRNWSADGDARSALDMLAEVALLNGTTAQTLENRNFPDDYDFALYAQDKTELAQDWPALKKMLDENTARVVEAMLSVPDEDISLEVQMPWGAMTLAQLMSYPYWNACYHEGQINFIASMLGCLE